MRIEIKWKLSILVLILSIASILSVIIVSVSYLNNRSLELIESKESIIGTTVGHLIDEYLDIGFGIDELEGMNKQLQLIASQYKEISSAYITDLNGKIIYHNKADLIGSMTNLEKFDQKAQKIGDGVLLNTVTLNGTTYYETVLPIIFNEEILGRIRIDVPQGIIMESTRRLVMIYIYVIIISFIGIMAITVLLIRKLVEPLSRLKESTDYMARGNYSIRSNISSDDEIGDLSRAFNYMAEEIEKNHRELEQNVQDLKKLITIKTDFLHTVNHQIRTPLTALIGYLSLWRDKRYSKLPLKKQEEINQKITLAADQLSLIIEGMMEAVEVEGGNIRLKIEDIDLTDLAEQTIKGNFEETLKDKKLSLTKDIGKNIGVISDKKYLISIIMNLLDNAIRYTTKGSVGFQLKKTDRSVIIKVEDTGIGLSEEDKKILYDKFSRGSEAMKISPSGNGIGLYITKQMVEELGGTITASSPGRNKGATFIAQIPEIYETHKHITN